MSCCWPPTPPPMPPLPPPQVRNKGESIGGIRWSGARSRFSFKWASLEEREREGGIEGERDGENEKERGRERHRD